MLCQTESKQSYKYKFEQSECQEVWKVEHCAVLGLMKAGFCFIEKARHTSTVIPCSYI